MELPVSKIVAPPGSAFGERPGYEGVDRVAYPPHGNRRLSKRAPGRVAMNPAQL